MRQIIGKTLISMRRSIFNNFQCLRYSHQQEKKILEQLKNRSLLLLNGPDSSNLLQGLITNDMQHFNNGTANIYTLFLNIKGRVLYDSIIYKHPELNDSYYIECDKNIQEQLHRHLNMYRLRRKVEIKSLDSKMNIWTLFNPNLHEKTVNQTKFEGRIFPCGNNDNSNSTNNNNNNNTSSKKMDKISIYEDPRLVNLGLRILTEIDVKRDDIVKNFESEIELTRKNSNYHEFRYKLGIAEGVDDLPPGKPLPLDINGDYLHGISFHKGCYIGQELTARTHYTGIVRKRLMPLLFNDVPKNLLNYDETIVNELGKPVGKFRGIVNQYGLGLVRISEALNSQSLEICGTKVTIFKPFWWPQEAQKQEISAKSNK
ncbi:putative transferase CAF17 homolog, mitochondrial [Leptopilina boulardi]|uniref:putative transferase CAF17 homolog, mitochondrial n=1 Tax=Leptopilina boulardi TaxID=63433 RepID=UPI0021F58081|nr:putative transferase CAF17 homolog, mitochondrial [Leptopilina boulardi]